MTVGLAAVLTAGGCGPEPPADVTPPPEPAELVPWPDTLAWAEAQLAAHPQRVVTEHLAAVAADDSGFVAVGFHETGPQRDGVIWHSPDGRSWAVVGVPAAMAGVDLVDVAAGVGGFVALGTSLEEAITTTVIYRSDDGERWERLAIPGAGDSYAGSVAGGPGGYVVTGNAGDGGSATWVSSDGRTWDRVAREAMAAGGGGVIDPQAVGDGWVALGSNVQPPVLLRSSDGIAWSATSIESESESYGSALVIGRWGYIVQGGLGACGPLAFCPEDTVAWWSGDGGRWTRMPLEAGIANGGAILVEADDHGVIQLDGANARSSATGWSWTPLPEPGDGTAVVNAAVVRGDVIVAVGEVYDAAGGSTGRIIVAE
jgi:hypothetical protein